MAGIHAYAVHVPRLQVTAAEVQRATGRAPRLEAKRVPDHDEDEVTLAIAAARALHALPGHGPEPAFVATASATAPAFGGLLLDALGLGGARLVEPRGALSGLHALLAAQDAVQAGNAAALVVSADAPRFAPDDEREAAAGAAATAWLVTSRGPAQLRRSAHASLGEVPGSPRSDAALAEALRGLTKAGLGADSVTRCAGPDLDPRLAAALQRGLPKAQLAQPGRLVGEAGATAPLLGLAQALEEARAGETVVLAAAGGGSAAAVSLEVEQAPAARALAQALAHPEPCPGDRLARLRGWFSTPRPDVSQGAAVSPAQWTEALPARLRFEGQRCAACQRLQFPPREACLGCGGAAFQPARLAGRGTVYSVSTLGRGSAPAEFQEQQRRTGAYDVAIVALDEGPRVAAMVADATPGALRLGDAVELVVRRLYTQEGAPRYGFKARPVPGA